MMLNGACAIGVVSQTTVADLFGGRMNAQEDSVIGMLEEWCQSVEAGEQVKETLIKERRADVYE